MSTQLHDSGYKKLFSNHTIFRQCLESFVNEPWVKELDFSQCETVDKSFISDEYKRRESDLLYKIKWQDQEIYLYVLIEFQSTVDTFMIVRMIYYIASFYMKYLQEHEKIEKLPALFPIVMYNGSNNWTAVTDFADLLDNGKTLGDYGLHCKYFTLDINRYLPEQLLRIHNIVSTLFLAESNYKREWVIDEIARLFDQESDRQAVLLLINWFKQWTKHGKITEEDFAAIEDVYHSSEEVKSMLKTVLEQEREEFLQKGIDKRNQQVVHAMYQNGFDLATIAKLLQLSLVKVEQILQEQATESNSAINSAAQA